MSINQAFEEQQNEKYITMFHHDVAYLNAFTFCAKVQQLIYRKVLQMIYYELEFQGATHL